MSVEFAELSANIKFDKDLATDLLAKVQGHIGRPVSEPELDGTAVTVALARQFVSDRQGIKFELDLLRRNLFFARVNVQFDRDPRPTAILLTKARAAGEVYSHGQWEIISYTSPLYAHILDRPVNSRFSLANGNGGVIGTSGSFESVLPEIRRASYLLRSGKVFVESEHALAQASVAPPTTRPTKEYRSATTFGLGEIIELADSSQRTAMHLPFSHSVLIEGPPGSGKTSVGIMRIPCLIDRQWEELKLDRRKDRPFHEPESMRVLVMNEEMVDYLGDLVRSLRIEGVVVETLHDLLLRACDDARVLKGPIADEVPSLAQMKNRPAAVAAVWSGFQRHSRQYLVQREKSRVMTS